MDWITTANGLIALITAFFGLVGTAAGAFMAVKTFIKSRKDKSFKENLELLKSVADAAMISAEKSGKKGAEKKEMVIQAVKDAAKAADLNFDLFIDSISAFIDQSIQFANSLNK